jgi:hypothetical protein
MSDPNRPRQSPSGSQHWRQDDQRSQRREQPRSSSRSENARPPSRDGGSRSRDAGRYDDARAPKRTRALDSDDGGEGGWDDSIWEDERQPRGSRGSRPGQTRSGREPDRSPHRSISSVGVSRGGRGPQGWDDAGWNDDEWEQGGRTWDDQDQDWDGRRGGQAHEDDVWQPASQRAVGERGWNNMAARAGAAWKHTTSQVVAATRRSSSLRERLRSDRKTQVIAAIMLVVILVCMIPTPILAYSNTMALAKDGTTHLKNAENDFKLLATSPTNLDAINAAQHELQLAHNDFVQLQPRVGLLAPVGILPKIGSKVAGANKLVPLAVEGTQAGILGCDALKVLVTGLKNPLGTTGGLTSANTDQIASDMDQIHTLYGQMEPILASLTQSDLSLDPGLWPTVSSLQAKLPQVNQLMTDMDGMAHALPQLLGVGKPATYLVLVLDSSELRPTGGFIGNFGALSLDSGRLDPGFHISDITLIDSSVKFGVPQVAINQTIPIPDKPPHDYSWLKTVFAPGGSDSWSLRDSNLDPDYPTTAKYALELYPELLPDAQTNLDAQGSTLKLYDPAKSGQFAGVVTLSLGFFAQALGVTGPIQVTDHRIHETVTADNFVSKIHYYALAPGAGGGPDSQACGTTSCAKVFTADVVKAFMAKLKSNLSGYLGKMGKLFYDSLHTKDVEVYLTPTAAQAVLHDLKLSAEVEAPPTGDSVYEVDANIGANKDNGVLKYQMADQISLDASGVATHHLNWQYAWPNDYNTLNEIFAAGNTDYHSYSRIFTPPNASLISQSNLSEFGHDTEFNRNAYHGAAYAYFAQTTKYGLAWKVPGMVTQDSAGYHYHLLFQREAGIAWPLTLTVTLPKCVTTATPPVTSGLTAQDVVTVKGNVVTITGPLTQDEQFQFNWTC